MSDWQFIYAMALMAVFGLIFGTCLLFSDEWPFGIVFYAISVLPISTLIETVRGKK